MVFGYILPFLTNFISSSEQWRDKQSLA